MFQRSPIHTLKSYLPKDQVQIQIYESEVAVIFNDGSIQTLNILYFLFLQRAQHMVIIYYAY